MATITEEFESMWEEVLASKFEVIS